MPYRVLKDEVGVLTKRGEFTDTQGNVLADDHDTVTKFKDDIVSDEEFAPVLAKLYEEGDAHVRSCFVKVDAKGKPVDRTPDPAVAGVSEPIVSKGGTGEFSVKETTEPVQPNPTRRAGQSAPEPTEKKDK